MHFPKEIYGKIDVKMAMEYNILINNKLKNKMVNKLQRK